MADNEVEAGHSWKHYGIKKREGASAASWKAAAPSAVKGQACSKEEAEKYCCKITVFEAFSVLSGSKAAVQEA